MNVKHNIFEVIEERQFKLFGHLKISKLIPKMITEMEYRERRRERRPRGQWIDGVKRSRIRKYLTEENTDDR